MQKSCEVRFTRYYRAAPAEVWAALTDADSLRRWLGPAVELGRVTRSEPERVLELDWDAGGEEPSVVRFDLTAAGEGTRLVLDHRRIDARIGMRAMADWERRLLRLQSLVERSTVAR